MNPRSPLASIHARIIERKDALADAAPEHKGEAPPRTRALWALEDVLKPLGSETSYLFFEAMMAHAGVSSHEEITTENLEAFGRRLKARAKAGDLESTVLKFIESTKTKTEDATEATP